VRDRPRPGPRLRVLQAVAGAALLVFGLIGTSDPAVDVLSLNWGENVLHGLTALIGLGTALGPVRRTPVESAR